MIFIKGKNEGPTNVEVGHLPREYITNNEADSAWPRADRLVMLAEFISLYSQIGGRRCF